MSYTEIDDPSAYFQTVLFASKGAITFDGSSDLQPDMIWNKNRDSAGYSHHIVDSVRGVSKLLRVDSNIAEFTSADSITSLNTDGFTIGNDANGYMQSGSDKIVTWGWKAGTSFTNDASATGIGSIDSSGSVSDTAGFSICSFTGTGSNGTIKHGLSTAPRMIIFKQRNGTGYWLTYHASIGAGTILRLDTDDAKSDSSVWFQNTDPTSSVFSVGTSSNNNGSSNTYIAYCFAEKKGYSKFGSYTGNGSASDGVFIYTGFKPAFTLIKQTSGADKWSMFDAKRNPFNEVDLNIRANQSDAEVDQANKEVDYLSNGIKLRTSSGEWNSSGSSYIYMCFAESPFVTSTGIPTTAR
jgi:hypothetical protein